MDLRLTWNKIVAFFVALICTLLPDVIAARVLNTSALVRVPKDLAATDKIHFLKTGGSDAIVLESDGRFAMVDAGEDSDNPRHFSWLDLDGYEQEVLAYLKEHAADENGKVHLDFILGTHAHSDHIGGFDTIVLDPDVTVERAYLKTYDARRINDYEQTQWDNQEVYDQMVSALNERGVPIVSDPDGTPFTFGNFTVTLFNTDDPESVAAVGENDNSLGVLLEKNGTRIFLAGDMDNNSGDEDRLAPEIGEVDLLKVGHHCYSGSSTENFIRTLMPKACVITNNSAGPDRTVLAKIVHDSRQKNIYITGNENGVLAAVGDSGKIAFYGGICE